MTGKHEGGEAPGCGPQHAPARVPGSGPVRPLFGPVLLACVLLAGACGWGGTTEVSDGGWSNLEFQGPGGVAPAPTVPIETLPDGSPAPQVMAEVTTPDGAVPSVPQPSVPAAAPPPVPGVLRAPEVSAEPLPSVITVPPTTLPPPPPDEARALEDLRSERSRAVAADALSRVRYDWRGFLRNWQIRFLPGRAGYRGSTFPQDRVIEVYVRDSDTAAALSHVIAHEIGHAVDVELLDGAERAAWRVARGIPAEVPWFPGSGATDYSTGAGDFAESFARWQTGVDWYSQLGPPPNVVQTALLAELSVPG